jgi:hypothetical protein
VGEAFAALAVLVIAAIQALVSFGILSWGRWVARRHGTAAWRYASWMPFGALVLMLMQYTTMAVMLVRGFDDVSAIGPEGKARFLGERISGAMNAGSLFGVPSWLLYTASLVAFTVGSIRKPRERT